MASFRPLRLALSEARWGASAAELQGLHRPPGGGVEHHQIHLARVGRVGGAARAELKRHRGVRRHLERRHGPVLAHHEVVLQRHAFVLTRLDGGDVALFGHRPVRGQPQRRSGGLGGGQRLNRGTEPVAVAAECQANGRSLLGCRHRRGRETEPVLAVQTIDKSFVMHAKRSIDCSIGRTTRQPSLDCVAVLNL